MTQGTATALRPVFKFGTMTLPFVIPTMAPEEALRLYHAAYPHLAHCTLEPPVVEGTDLVYKVLNPPAQTKG